MTFDVNEIIKVLCSLEKLFCISLRIFIGHWRMNYNIDALVPVELVHLFHVDAAIADINLIHDVEDGSDSCTLESLNIHFI